MSSSAWGPLLATWQQHTSFWRAYADLCWRSLGRKQGLFRVTFRKEEVAWLKRKANETGEKSWEGRCAPLSKVNMKFDVILKVCMKFENIPRVCAKLYNI
jgi:hypothetical protein